MHQLLRPKSDCRSFQTEKCGLDLLVIRCFGIVFFNLAEYWMICSGRDRIHQVFHRRRTQFLHPVFSTLLFFIFTETSRLVCRNQTRCLENPSGKSPSMLSKPINMFLCCRSPPDAEFLVVLSSSDTPSEILGSSCIGQP